MQRVRLEIQRPMLECRPLHSSVAMINMESLLLRINLAAINMESLLLQIDFLGEDLGAYLKDMDTVFSIFLAILQP